MSGPTVHNGPNRVTIRGRARRFTVRASLEREEKEQKKQMDEDLNDIVNKTELFSKVGFLSLADDHNGF